MSVISAPQCRAARGLLGWSQGDLARSSGVSEKSIADFERQARVPYERTVRDLMTAFETAGIEFTNGDAPGLKMKSETTTGFIYDDKKLVAHVRNGEVFTDTRPPRKVAVVRAGELYDAETGAHVGTLAEIGAVGTALPNAIKNLLR
jgi:transcriptional regulator with XRE-family HTH domain